MTQEPTLYRVVLALVALFGLTFAAGSTWVRKVERRLGVSMLSASGLSFVLLGAVAHHPRVGLLPDDLVQDLLPVVQVALGCIGFRIGTEFDVRELERLPAGVGAFVAVETAISLLLAGLGATALLALATGGELTGVVRDGLLLGACAAVSAPTGARVLHRSGLIDEGTSKLLRRVAIFGDAAAIAVVSLLFRPTPPAPWALPPIGWAVLQLGLGTAAGLVMLGVVRRDRGPETSVATFAAVAFAAGLAAAMGLSPLVVGTVTGVVVATGSKGAGADPYARVARAIERPVYLILFAIVGAHWDFGDPRGWLLLVPFVIGRVFGKYVGPRLARGADAVRPGEPRATLPPVASLGALPIAGLALLPTSAMSIAVLVDVTGLAANTSFLQTPVLVGGIVCEIVYRVALRQQQRRAGVALADEDVESDDAAASGPPLGGPA